MPEPVAKSPLSAVMDIRKNEWPMALTMAGYFFFVITTFWILKPIKKSLFIEHYDQRAFDLFGWTLRAAQAELLAKVLNMFVAFAAVVVFSWLSRRLRRQQLTHVFSGFFAVTYVAYAFLLSEPTGLEVWTFYLYGDLYSTLMVATFFAFLNDSIAPEVARRIYGLVVLGGVLGGVLGTSIVSNFITELDVSVWLWLCLGIGIVITALAELGGRLVRRNEELRASRGSEAEVERSSEADENPALAGARLVARSRYLLSIVAIVGLYELVSTLMDFQFSSTVAHYLDGPAIGQHFSTVFMITNITSMLVQVFATGFLMSRFRLTVALLVLPAAALSSSAVFLIFPALWVGSALNTADNAFAYSVNQSAKEALYTPTTRDEKYKAKALIDMFVQRFAKALAVGVSLLVTTVFTAFSSVRWLSLVTVLLVVVWVVAARYAGRRFHEFGQTAAR